jgi:hypothetical protein
LFICLFDFLVRNEGDKMARELVALLIVFCYVDDIRIMFLRNFRCSAAASQRGASSLDLFGCSPSRHAPSDSIFRRNFSVWLDDPRSLGSWRLSIRWTQETRLDDNRGEHKQQQRLI